MCQGRRDDAGLGLSPISHCGDAKVSEFGPSKPVDEDIVWLDIAMQHMLFVRCCECIGRLDREYNGLAPWDRA